MTNVLHWTWSFLKVFSKLNDSTVLLEYRYGSRMFVCAKSIHTYKRCIIFLLCHMMENIYTFFHRWSFLTSGEREKSNLLSVRKWKVVGAVVIWQFILSQYIKDLQIEGEWIKPEHENCSSVRRKLDISPVTFLYKFHVCNLYLYRDHSNAYLMHYFSAYSNAYKCITSQ